MTLKEHIENIRENLKKDLFTTEAVVSGSIVRRLLNALGWPIFDPQVIIPEYSVGGRRVDFALCPPSSKPLVFIEVKQVGNIEGSEGQLFEYAFHEGVPIAILTDGQKWRFFYPIGQGDYRERKVHELDLIEGDIEESAKRINRYLNYESIQSGKAIEAIKADYEKVVQQRQVATHLPEAWSELVQEKNDYLLLAMMEKVKSKIGYEPTEEQVLNFLKSLQRKIQSPVKNTPSPPIPSVQPLSTPRRGPRTQKAPQKRLVVTTPNGEKIEDRKATNTFCEVIEKIGIERVHSLNLGLCAVSLITPIRDWQGTYQQKHESKCGRYYITTHGSVATLAAKLKEIAERLGVNMKVDHR